MGFRFRKSIKIAPGVKVNLGKKSVGVSVGGKYGGVSVNSRTGARARVSAPGTGMSYSQKIGKTSARKPARQSHDYGVTTFYVAGEELDNTPIPTQESLQEQLKRAKRNLFVAKYVEPTLGALCVLLGIAAQVFWIIAALCFYFSYKSRKLYKEEIPRLELQAAQIGAVQDDLAAICAAEDKVDHADSAALFFLHLDEIIQHTLVVLEKAPALSEYSTPAECREAILALFESKCAEIMQKEFEKTYKHLFTLKTAKGIESNIERFQAPYEANLDKLTPAQKSEYEEYLAKLQTVQLSPAE